MPYCTVIMYARLSKEERSKNSPSTCHIHLEKGRTGKGSISSHLISPSKDTPCSSLCSLLSPLVRGVCSTFYIPNLRFPGKCETSTKTPPPTALLTTHKQRAETLHHHRHSHLKEDNNSSSSSSNSRDCGDARSSLSTEAVVVVLLLVAWAKDSTFQSMNQPAMNPPRNALEQEV